MNILYFYPELRGDFMFQWQRMHFIDELSRNNIYFDILNLYRNSSLSVMTMATILETLLLKKNESNQRKVIGENGIQKKPN